MQPSPPNTVITTWSPDHCNCMLNYSWDRNSDPANRVHTYYSPQQAVVDGHSDKVREEICEDHLAFGLTGADHFSQVMAENQRKNQFLAHLAQQAGMLDASGNPAYADIPYHFDSQRALNVATVDVAAVVTRKGVQNPRALAAATMQASANSMFGPGKVKVS